MTPEQLSSPIARTPLGRADLVPAAWPPRMWWALGTAYLILAPLAFLPGVVQALLAEVPGHADLVLNSIPMITRVVGYRHPDPQRLTAFLAFAWTVVPLLWVVIRGAHGKYCRPYSWGTADASALLRYFVAVTLAVLLLAYLWYWPALSSREGPFLSARLGERFDGRRRLFGTDAALAFCTPIWTVLAAAMLDVIVVETRAILAVTRRRIRRRED